MKPETILRSDMLDIIFDNRNKEYGAYALRRNYNHRLMQALGATTLLVAGFAVMQFMGPANKDDRVFIPLDGMTFTTVVLDEEKPVEEPKIKPEPTKIRTEVHTVPVITDNVTETTVATTDQLDRANIGTRRTEGVDAPEGTPGGAGGEGTAPVTINAPPPAPIVVPEPAPRTHAAVMPAFDGNLMQYLLRNIRQPDDLAEGERVVVKVRFVVDATGNITDAVVIQPGRADLDQEVLRVVKKMPRWKPGMHDGENVPVYFNLPVTFVSPGE